MLRAAMMETVCYSFIIVMEASIPIKTTYALTIYSLTVIQFVYYNCNIQTYSIRKKKYHRELYIWPKHSKAIMKGSSAVL